jgi:glycine oxidase
MNRYDVAIAGGGVIGGAIALELACAGIQVALFDAQEPGQEASWASAGIISALPESPLMVPLLSISRASAALYPEFVRTVEALTGQDVGYRAYGTLEAILPRDKAPDATTVAALHHGFGLKAESLSAQQARALEPDLTEAIQAAVLRPDEASVDNRQLTVALLEAAKGKGVEVFANNGATSLWKDGKRCRGLVLEKERVEAGWTVIAAGCFSAGIEGVAPYAPVVPAKGQMVSLRCGAVSIRRVLWGEKIYLVPRNDGRILAGATVEYVGFDRHVSAGNLRKILAAAIELVPALDEARVEESWAGLRPDSPDHLPILGPTDLEGLVVATGHFRNGMLLAPITGRLIREWIASGSVSVEWERFSPLRFLQAPQSRAI